MTEFHANVVRFLAEGDTKAHFRHAPKPELAPQLSLAKQASTAREHKGAYRPAKPVTARLRLSEAVRIGTEQNSWDDTTVYVIPYEGEAGEDAGANLWTLSAALRTANGVAGYGATWDLTLIREFGVIVARQRCSIPD